MKRNFSIICILSALTSVLCVLDPYSECLNLLNVNEDELHLIAVQENTSLSDKSGEYFLCVWKMKSIINEDGIVNVDKLKEFIKEELNRVMRVSPYIEKFITDNVDNCDLSSADTHTKTAIKVKNCHAKIMVNVLVPK
ncbi:hypothetical protein RN001_009374 [Aquatica leii]|uniref:Uncharacterized protein n=1 Tax=Aquatica leii TaxID=1421715 RepID=A0AAN7SMW8_9COLE|nr:hypothetical protein RN001_009374 [Aquatica leii]